MRSGTLGSPAVPPYIPPLPLTAPPDRHAHAVQMYEDDAFLIEAAARYFIPALRQGESTIVIATEAHRDALEARFYAAGLDVAEARAAGRHVALDAREVLAQFMVDDLPDAARFDDVVGTVVANAALRARRPPVRAFGEMVALLWADGNADAALRLEALWNGLAERLPFSLLCGYPLSVFARDAHRVGFGHVCDAHTQVIPAESWPGAEVEDDRARAVAKLQQRAAALEAEVAARQAAEAALRRQRDEMAEFFDNAALPIHWVDGDGAVVKANRAELELLGYTADEYIGHHVAEFHVDQPVIDALIGRLAQGETVRGYEARLRCKDGSIRHVSIDSNVLFEDGRFRHTRCFTRDVTDRRRAEAERERLLAAAEQAREEAEAASRTKDEFLSVVSHELRTPLAAVLGWVGVLKTGVTGERAARAIETIERSGRAQAKLIEDLLDVSRIVGGRMRLDLRLVDLPPIMQAALDTIRPAADAKGVHLAARLDPTAGPVAGDADRLQQAAWNLLSNAVKFTPPGGRVDLRLERRDDGVRLTVSDTGRGIAPAFLPFVFERFRQADMAETRRTGGLGLGLAIVRHLVELHGGEVGVASDGEGLGAAFTVTLPLTPLLGDAAGFPAAARALDGVRVLLVDDEEDARESLGTLLRSHGARVTPTASVAEARAALRAEVPDIVVSDICLPDEDGYTLARELLATERFGRVPAIAVTGHEAEDDDRALTAGYRVRLRKPVEPALLLAAVAQLTARPKRH